MPIFQMDQNALVPFKRQAIASGVYEHEIELLLWDNLEELTGDNLFRVARQAILPAGGKPDIVALDETGRVVVIEVKRDVDRGQLAQTLEYAGWARTTNLDQLAGLYHGGPGAFWDDWREFTESASPVLVQKDPRLVLVARTFDQRTFDALQFLMQHKLPIKLLKVAFYIDTAQNRILNVEWEAEPEATWVQPGGGGPAPRDSGGAGGSHGSYLEVTLAEVAAAVTTPADLVWKRPKKGQEFKATLLDGGIIRVADGKDYKSPSGAAMAVAAVVSYDGWYAWRVVSSGKTLDQYRRDVAASKAVVEEAPGAPPPVSSEDSQVSSSQEDRALQDVESAAALGDLRDETGRVSAQASPRRLSEERE